MSKILLFASLIIIPVSLNAQTAEDYFHRGAQFYVFGDDDKAVTEVQKGLQHFANDPQLKSLADLLAKQKQKQHSQQDQKQDSKPKQQQKDDQQQQQQQKPKPDDKQQQDQQKQPTKPEQQKPEDKSQSAQNKDKPDDKERPEDKNSSRAQNQPGKEPNETAERPAIPGQMTKEQVQKLLDAAKGEEKAMIFQPPEKTRNKARVFKDW